MPIPYLDKLKETAEQIAVLGRPKPADGVNRVESRDHDAQPLDSHVTHLEYRPFTARVFCECPKDDRAPELKELTRC